MSVPFFLLAAILHLYVIYNCFQQHWGLSLDRFIILNDKLGVLYYASFHKTNEVLLKHSTDSLLELSVLVQSRFIFFI